MRILIDADGCPVVDVTIHTAKQHKVPVLLLCDTAHFFEREGAETITVSKGADAVDFKLVNLLKAGDIVVTQDYGLAAMCLARQAKVLSQDGMEYTHQNIDALLLSRHTAKKIRQSGGRLKGNPKRNRPVQDQKFRDALVRLIRLGSGQVH